jgi:hypothetical protein
MSRDDRAFGVAANSVVSFGRVSSRSALIELIKPLEQLSEAAVEHDRLGERVFVELLGCCLRSLSLAFSLQVDIVGLAWLLLGKQYGGRHAYVPSG